MPTSSAFLPVWVVAPIGFLVLLILAGHLISVKATVADPRRRRIRLATSGLLMLIVPILCYGLSGATPARSREFVLVWLLVASLVMFVILLALADMVHSLQLHRAHLRALRKSLATGRARAPPPLPTPPTPSPQNPARIMMRGTETRHRGRGGGPLPPPIGMPLSWLYRAAISRINRRFDKGRGVVIFDRPVISVGNLSVGGTGKTPMVRLIIRWLLEAGHRPCIAMRGYRGGESAAGSDEASAYQRAMPDVPVVAQANRTLGLIQLFVRENEGEHPHSDCIVLDDGFQHRQIARDLDLVLLDASRNPFRDRLLPAGWLRERVDSLRRAGAVVITHAESVSPADITELNTRIAGIRGGEGATAICRHAWTGVLVRRAGADASLPVSVLAGQRVLAVCAIGNPGPFMAAAEKAAGGPLAARLVLRDHDPFGNRTVHRIVETARASSVATILTTEKNWSKLARVPESRWPCAIARPKLDLIFDRGEADLKALVLDAATPVGDDSADQAAAAG